MSDERNSRIKALEAIRELGVEPYGGRVDGVRPVGELRDGFEQLENQVFTISGRVTAIRKMGKSCFCDLHDRTGKIQFHVGKNKVGEAWAVFEQVHIGDIVSVTGTLQKTRTGEITVFSQTLSLLTKALRPLPEKWHGVTDPEVRYRQRYLDLVSNPEVREKFVKRTRIISRLRRYLDDRGYLEVETPMMQSIPGGAAARPFVTHHNALDRDLYLRIALEIPLKKLLVGGLEKVYEIGRVFRNEGISTQHNPEFTELELYHAGGDLRTMMELLEGVTAHLAQEVAGGTKVKFGDRTLDLTPPWPRREFGELIKEHAGVDIADIAACRAKAAERKPDAATMNEVDLLDTLFGEFVEPHLQDACFVTAQPIGMSPLCREIPDRPGFADRFEAYIAGFEVSNAYTELTDPLEQRRRLEEQAGGDEMSREGKVDEDFLAALEHGMPPAGGIGVGIDRLVMVLTDNPSIREVILFPVLRS